MQELWGSDRALSVFLASCPRLYDLRTVAYWLLEREAHNPAFLSRLAHVTQLLIELRTSEDGATIRVAKAEGRAAEVTGRRGRLVYDDSEVRVVREEQGARARMGELLRSRRIARGVSQAEFARLIGISPSALSQAERGLTGLSGETLSRAWAALDVPFGLPVEERASYQVSRRGARETRSLVAGMVAEHVIETSAGDKIYILRVDGDASGRRAPFATKRDEVAVVLRGVFEVRIGEVRETLHAGDALLLSDEPLSWWRNPGAEEAELLWAVLD